MIVVIRGEIQSNKLGRVDEETQKFAITKRCMIVMLDREMNRIGEWTEQVPK